MNAKRSFLYHIKTQKDKINLSNQNILFI